MTNHEAMTNREAMPISARSLRFSDAELERQFRAEYGRSSVRAARATTILIIGLYLGYALLDVRGGILGTVWLLRVFVVAFFCVVLALTWHPVFERRHSEILACGGIVAALGMLGMMATVSDRTETAYYPGIGLAIIGVFALFRIRFAVALAAGIVIAAAYWTLRSTGDFPYETPWWAGSYILTCLLIGGFAGWHIERYARQSFLARRGLEREQARSERLLLNVLPAPIAARLKADPAPIADRFPEASILFADIVGFTRMSSGMPPEELVAMLNEVFTAFDRVGDRFGLEKIKTIGDAYMAVSGVPSPCPDHLERIADAAIEMRDITSTFARDGRPRIAVRIGVDTGPVVAGVIGERKFIYDLWGDPVTLASRMESQGVEGAIQLTERAAARLRARYVLTSRGPVDVKGRGTMATYLLESRRDGPPATARCPAPPPAPPASASPG